MLNKKAQLGETMTWIVATLIIIVILLIFIYVSSVLSGIKKIGISDLKFDLDEKKDFISSKTTFAYLNKEISEEETKLIKNWIEEEER
ncbi:hypothetical protein KAJ87_02545 [Candidatus Pacearchaeota archaeon]|nr:hypothetical protein [Candidatus Pacearchaeota archaeon]